MKEDYITRFREKFVINIPKAGGDGNIVQNQWPEELEQFLTTLATEQFESGKAVGEEEAIKSFKSLVLLCSDMYGRGGCGAIYDTILDGLSQIESARNQKSI